ncbi:hypothetical protein, partial [Frankia sp. EI5c]|uniref:hypothetical protein n=1 Tax=Frankia sp. EI5c TaxID=683316 RepID=UPI001F5BF414
ELPARAAARTLDEFGLIDRLTALPGPLTLSSAPGWRPPFTLPGGGLPGVRHTSLPGQDAIVFVGAPPAPGLEPPSATATSTDLGTGTSTGTRPGSAAPPPPWSRGRFFGGVFHTELEGVFRVSPDPELAGPQGRWIGEYLRGRYLLPARSVMIRDPAAAGVRRPARRYLKGLARELRQGHARASRAGYPLPVPARAR